jgi:hypothetical protein
MAGQNWLDIMAKFSPPIVTVNDKLPAHKGTTGTLMPLHGGAIKDWCVVYGPGDFDWLPVDLHEVDH